MRTLIRNGKIIKQANELLRADLLLEDGKIKAIGRNFAEDETDFAKIYDVCGAVVLPGLIDVHVHFREPGFEDEETIATGSTAAAHGGFTQVCAMPNVFPTPDCASKMANIYLKIKSDAIVKVHQYAPITKNRESEVELVNFHALAKAGAWAFSNDGSGIQTASTMYSAMCAARKVAKPIVAHAEDKSLMNNGVMRLGSRSKELGIPGMPSIVESSQVARDLMLAQEAGCHYHVCHISSKETVRIIRVAKRAGIKVTCEVTPHHLLLTDEDIISDDAKWKMNPPLATRQDKAALVAGLLDGTIDLIASDHAPHSLSEKQGNFINSAFGIVGLEHAFSLLYTNFVEKKIWNLEQLIQFMAVRPAKIFGMSGGELQVGASADITVMDLTKEFEIKEQDFESKSHNTPFLGWKVKGKTLLTFVDGKLVWEAKG